MLTDHISDLYKRPLRDLRISVTDRCNFRCRYCMPEELFGSDFEFLKEPDLLSFDEMEKLIQVFASLGVKKVRITGGEPLLRKNLTNLIHRLHFVEGIEDIALTTNGSLLTRYVHDLKKAGLDRITVSLDSLDPFRFHQMNGRRGDVKTVLEGIEAASKAGFLVKINMVVKKGVNDQDILPMAKYFKEKGHILRFIEYMDVGNSNGWRLEHVVPSKTIIDMIHQEMPLEPVDPNYYGEVANRYRYKGSNHEIGLISSVTEAFCGSCTRARLSAEGSLYTCLFSSKGYNLRDQLRADVNEEKLKNYIMNVWNQRDDRYSEERKNMNEKRKKMEMHYIGG